jgi:hypothetical protein
MNGSTQVYILSCGDGYENLRTWVHSENLVQYNSARKVMKTTENWYQYRDILTYENRTVCQ